jgi:hypothetical protein
MLVSLTSPIIEANEIMFKNLVGVFDKHQQTADCSKIPDDYIDECIDNIGIVARQLNSQSKLKRFSFFVSYSENVHAKKFNKS